MLFLGVFFAAIVWWWGSSWGRVGAAAGVIAAVLVMRGQFHGLLAGEVRTMIKSRRARTAAWAAGIALVIAALLWLPVRERAAGSFQLRSVKRAEVRAPLAAFIKDINCREGQRVERGQPLAQLEVPDLPTQLAQKRAQIEESNAKLLMYRYGASRLNAASIAEEADIRAAETKAEQARLEGLKHEAEFLSSQLAKLKILSPVTGIVSTPRLDQQIGRFVAHGELICTVEDPRELEAEIQIPEQDVRFIRPGQEVELHPRATVLKSVNAKVKRIAPAATTQPTQSVVSVYCEISDPELVAGMTGHARIDCGKRRAGRIVLEQTMRLLRTEYWW